MKCLFLNIYYENFLNKHYDLNKINHLEYMEQWVSVQDEMFGDADFYSRGLEAHGWDAHDLVTNCRPLQRQWAKEHDFEYRGKYPIWVEQIRHYEPDVVYSQGLWLINKETYPLIKDHCKLIVGQTATHLENFEAPQYDAIFTAVPQYVQKFRDAGTESHFLPLAFDTRAWERVKGQEKIYPVTFVGQLTAGHVRRKKVLEMIRGHMPIHEWIGELWGIDMYRVMAQSYITINCNIDTAFPYGGNMRMYEATGCGALLLTDRLLNLPELFEEDEVLMYRNPIEAIEFLNYYLRHRDQGMAIAAKGQARTHQDHTYEQRMAIVAEVLEKLL